RGRGAARRRPGRRRGDRRDRADRTARRGRPAARRHHRRRPGLRQRPGGRRRARDRLQRRPAARPHLRTGLRPRADGRDGVVSMKAPASAAARRTAAAALALALGAAASGCAAFGGERSGIVVTTNILGDITRNIVGDEAEVTVLMKPNADPHSFGISAQQAAALEEAELVVYNGLGLEEGVLRNVESAEEAGVPVLAAGEHADPLDYTEGETAGEPDPHFWTDPVRTGDA